MNANELNELVNELVNWSYSRYNIDTLMNKSAETIRQLSAQIAAHKKTNELLAKKIIELEKGNKK